MSRAMPLALELARLDHKLIKDVLDVLSTELAVHSLHHLRTSLRMEVALIDPKGIGCAEAVDEMTEWVPWERRFLMERVDCYTRLQHPKLALAKAELEDYLDDAGMDFGGDLRPDPPLPPRDVATLDKPRSAASIAPPPPTSAPTTTPSASASTAPTAAPTSAPTAKAKTGASGSAPPPPSGAGKK